jgi:hypothetical protein
MKETGAGAIVRFGQMQDPARRVAGQKGRGHLARRANHFALSEVCQALSEKYFALPEIWIVGMIRPT